MTAETAKRAVDYFLSRATRFERVNWEFIGGEPLLEMDLISEITEYIKDKSKGHRWEKAHTFAMTTNGTLLGDEKVRAYLLKDKCQKSVGISLDGIKEIHDQNRDGSWDAVMANFAWWRAEFPWCTTKSTLNREALPYLFESVRYLASLGLEQIFINPVHEIGWTDDDARCYYDQLVKVADYLLDTGIYQSVHVSPFNEACLKPGQEARGWCGCGTAMVMVDPQGSLYPCLRFYTGSRQWPIGDIFNGIETDRMTPFYFCHNEKTAECIDCPVRGKCPHCLGWDYECTGSIFTRSMNNCKMFKAQVAANRYFFRRLSELEAGVNIPFLENPAH